MKLLIDQSTDNMTSLLESESTSTGVMYIEGPFAMAEDINRNKRRYPKGVMEKAVDTYLAEYVNERRALGELNHPARPFPDPAEAAILIESLSWQGNYVIGKAQVLNTPKGQIVKALWEAKFKGGVSTRGLGETKSNGTCNEVTKYLMNAVDVVDRPSGQVCYVEAISEGTEMEWVLNESTGVWSPKEGGIGGGSGDVKTFNESAFLNNLDRYIEELKRGR